jgi:hypothetical protein
MSEPTEQPGFFYKTAEFLVDRRLPLFVLLVAMVIGSLYFAPNVRVDNSLELWFLESDPTLTAYREFKKIYGNDEVILALIDCGAKEGIFSLGHLKNVFRASREIEGDTANFKRVLSIGLAPYIGLKDGNELIVEDLMTGEPKTSEEGEVVKQRFLDDPFKIKLLSDPTQRYAILIAEPTASSEMDQKRPEIIKSVRDKLRGFSYKLAGMGVMYDELNQISMRDGALFITVSYLVIVVVSFLLYRSWIFTLLVIKVMVLGGLGFMGVYGFFRQNINMVTMVLPTLMLILSVSDVTFVYNNYCYNIDKVVADKRRGLITVFSECLSPCLFTSLTNFFGFISIVTSPMLVLRGFGFFAAFATMAEYLVSMITAAFLLGLLTPRPGLVMARPFERQVNACIRQVPFHYGKILTVFLLATIFGILGIMQLHVDTYSMGFLHKNNPVRVDSDAVEKEYGNYLPLEIRLITEKDDGIKDPGFLKRLSEAHDDLEKMPEIQRAASIVDVLKKMNQVMSDGSAASYQIPDSFDKASQLLMLYGSDPDNDLEHMTDTYFKEARLTVRVPMVSAAALHRIEGMVRTYLDTKFAGTGVKIIFGGYVPLYSRLIQYLTQSQVWSFSVAMFFIFGAMSFLFRRVSAIWLGIIPNIFPIIMTLGIMGWVGIRLDIATVTIASIALGVAVDDTIHELFLFFHPSRQHLDPVESITDSLVEAGPAVVSTSIIYILGFSVLAMASIKSVIYFGVLLAIALFIALLCEVTILPALICQFKSSLMPKGGPREMPE